MERSQEKHSEEHVHSIIEAEPAAEDVCDVMKPDISFCKRFEEFSTASLEVDSSGSSGIGVSNLDPMMIDGIEALEGKPPGASAGCTDSRTSQVASADAATSILSGIEDSETKPEAIPELDAELESKAEPDSQCSREVQGPLCCHFDMYSDSDCLSESGGDCNDEGSEMKGFSNIVWLMRGKCAWEHKEDGLFVCMTINDVIKHCLEKFGLQTAQNIWGWVTNSTRKYWRCFGCNKRFPDQESHMLHLESDHDLGISWDHERLVPSQVQQESQSGVNEGIEERTDSLDDSITVDCTYRRFIMEMEKFGSLYQKEEEGDAQNINKFWQIVRQIQQKKVVVPWSLYCLFLFYS